MVLMKSNVPVGFFRHEDFENLRNKARKVLPPMFTELVVSTEEPFIQAIFDGVIPAMAFGRICIMDDAAFAAPASLRGRHSQSGGGCLATR